MGVKILEGGVHLDFQVGEMSKFADSGGTPLLPVRKTLWLPSEVTIKTKKIGSTHAEDENLSVIPQNSCASSSIIWKTTGKK